MSTTDNETTANTEKNKPGSGPAPCALIQDELSRLLREQRF
ncbi:hypothetical protein [Microtetraspora niveoalba]|nr:hypothetical protein [Microtetraspora niveoalba]